MLEIRKAIQPRNTIVQKDPSCIVKNLQQIQPLRIHIPYVLPSVILLSDSLKQLALKVAFITLGLNLRFRIIPFAQSMKVDA